MQPKRIPRIWVPVAAVLLAAPAAAQQAPAALPQGVTQQMITDGAAIYKAQGLCFACHGADAKGMPNLGANLTDTEWTHSDGSYTGILESIETGVQAASGAVMPPNGGANLTDAQQKAVAAYVWSLSRQGGA